MNEVIAKKKTIEELNEIADRVVDAIFSVHRNMGPGFQESLYEACLKEEMDLRKMKYECQLELPVIYKGKVLEKKFRLDMVVEDEIIVELKATTEILPVFTAQLMSYMKLSGKRIGYVANFGVPLMKHGLKRMRLDSGTEYPYHPY